MKLAIIKNSTTLFLITLLSSFATSILSQCPVDINGSGVVDGEDLLTLLASYGLPCDGIPTYYPSISEIHYNPSTLQGPDNVWEFIEIHNPHNISINLSGWSISDALNAVIPQNTWLEAGSYLVFANDSGAYVGNLPPSIIILPFSGSTGLHNSGETIRLIKEDGTEIEQVTYSDIGDWPSEPDGGGPSLEWKGPGFDNSLPSSWIASNAFGGSPGSANSVWAD